MKKIYNSPQTKNVKLDVIHMIAATTMTFQSSAGKKGTVLSREDRFWDDDDED